MKRIVRLLSLFAILSFSCSTLSGGGGIVEITGPILAVVSAESMDERGGILGQAHTFAPTTPQVTVIIQVAQLSQPAPLTVTWYSVGEQGDVRLFEHSIEVDSLDRAFSIGQNPGFFAAGTYKAVAALGEATQTVTWIVPAAQPELAEEDAASASLAQAAVPPASGASGKVPAAAQTGGGQSVGGCSGRVIVVPDPPWVNISGSSIVDDLSKGGDACVPLGDLEVMAAVESGTPEAVCTVPATSIAIPMGATFTGSGGAGQCKLSVNPCDLPGHTDLPGKVVHVDLRQKQSGQVLAQSSITLSADAAPPRVTLVPDPENFARVQEGQIITVWAVAEEVINAGWQSGVRKIEIIVLNPSDGGELFSKTYAEFAGKACGAKSWQQTTEKVKYKVPEGLKEDIRICAYGYDFDNSQPGQDCAIFHPGPKWQGTIHSKTTGQYAAAGTCTGEEWDLQFSVLVADDGSVSGSGEGHLTSMPQCSGGGFDGSELATQAHNVKFNVEGSFTGERFELQILETYIDGSTNGLYNYSLLVGSQIKENGLLLVPLLNDKSAQGETQTSFVAEGGFVATGTHQVTMTCINCDEGVVAVPGWHW